MRAKSDPIVQFKVRIRKQLRQRLEAEAHRHGCSANYEAMSRLERSFELENIRKLDDIAFDLSLNWARFSNQLTCNDLGEKLVQAIMQAEDLQQAKVLAFAWLKTRETGLKRIAQMEALTNTQTERSEP